MANINTDVGSFRDFVTEEVGCKSGLLLVDHEAHALLRRAGIEEAEFFTGDRDRYVRIRPEEVEEIILQLRHGVGELPDARHGAYCRIVWLKELAAKGIDVGPIYKAFDTVVRSEKYKVLGEEAAAEVVTLSGMHELLVAQFFLHIAEQMNRSVNWFGPERLDIGWAIPLNDVFHSENIPSDPEVYLDQRYIDYFSQNSEDLDRMHWRNFERLTTEFFRRHGYEVQLGPGSKDGGIDVRIWPEGSGKIGPPLIIVQCKRHANGNDVKVETVKAFWSDIVYEGAQHGLIATTSRVSPEGIKLSRARKWPLGFAQNKQVSHWVKTMWRHSRPNKG